ncbi:Mediator of RNA polymerase II transcription subunit 7 [Coemansia nantahalensis]|uniref:Mediator of RNA polymerase II transcription subunit 7 n=1 Tax=Coemansia nantahalensis TaxID=2789366 RepID=A0ACC1JVF4_9FUNG|nr:Mediator of RNA polymerase II transcription subunit 7 [Coemansia nantahalensis]KAJ2775130.1 Mediator of RNA polymerase II transcription subunit 7 [Coemansia nantahalensis]
MQESAQPGAGQQLDDSYPVPPDYYSLFTDDNLARLAAVGDEAALEDPELKCLLPPAPPEDGTYAGFGLLWQVHGRLPTLAEQNIPQLYPEGPVDRIAELKRLNRSVVFEFLDLVDVLVKDPSQFGARTARIRHVFINIHHLINEYRGHQAKETLKLMLRQQIDAKRQAAERTRAKCVELERAVERLRLEAAAAQAELCSQAAESSRTVCDEGAEGPIRPSLTQTGLDRILGTIDDLR